MLLVLATGLTRFVCRSRYLYDIDSINFALATGRFDPAVHQPHPPGYLLYVWLAKLVMVAIHEPNAALVAISIGASCGAAAMIFLLTRAWFGAESARFAALLFVFSPLTWFHGTVALTYIVEMFFSALTGYLCWKRSSCRSGFVLGLAAGFRPSSLLFLGPLFFFSLRGVARRRQLLATAILIATVLAWLVPMIRLSGGLSVFSSSLFGLWNTVPGRESILNSSLANTLARFLTIVLIYGLCFGAAAILPFLWRPPGGQISNGHLAVFTLVWICPGALFFTFVFLKFVNSGYLLVLSPPLFAWLGRCASRWWRAGGASRPVWRLAVAGACLTANLLIFLFAPIYCSYSSVRKFEREFAGVLASLPGVASPRDTLIVGFDSHFMGYRHAGYYLPDYVTIEYPRVRAASGPGISTMEHKDTRISPALPPQRYSRFILFPLPSADSAYSTYMAGIQSKLAGSGLQRVTSAERTFITGPVSALEALYPPESSAGGER